MLKHRTLILSLAVAVAATLAISTETANAQATAPAATQSGQTIRDAYKGIFLIGTAADVPGGFSGLELKLVRDHFNTLTPENSFKPASVHPAEERWTFERTDALMQWCQENNIAVHGHTLVWHAQTNPWFFEGGDKAVVTKRLQDHIATLVGRYKGKIQGWDVVNEAIADGPNPQTENLRNSPWLQTMGPEFLTVAFKAAHAADPAAKLYYNDYNIEAGAKHESSMHLLRRLISEGAPIHGVGIQGHWSTTSLPYDALDKAIANYRSLGLKVSITELDITVGGTSGGQLTQTGGQGGQAGPGGGGGFFGRGNRAAALNPSDAVRAAVTDLNDEQRGKLGAVSETFIDQMVQWQVSSQEAIQAAQPRSGQGRFPSQEDIARYNAVQYQQNLLRDGIVNEAEVAATAVLTPVQAQTWLKARLKAQVASRMVTMGLTEAQNAQVDTAVNTHATKLAEAKDKAALASAKAAFWKEIVGVLDDAQVAMVLAPAVDLSRSRIPGPLSAQAAKAQADAYARVFAILLKHKDVVERVTFWGLNDRRSWRMGENPLLFDVMNQPKPAYQAIVDAVQNPQSR